MRGAAAKLAAEATLMIPPRPSARRRGAKTWLPWMTPHRFTPSVFCQSASGAAPTT
ncbi:Uncharacterised protein [Mycobacteroides abscessus subsp. abscessus]|nr:Uncharacterised protein [Mycobacteroides abscessus subsp. abscessus]